jgi:large subunit ribosomal protein L25
LAVFSTTNAIIEGENKFKMKTLAINAEKRAEIGKSAAKAVRVKGLVPCVMYSGTDSVSFAAHPKELRDIIYTPDFKIAEVNIDGTHSRCILKAVQFHPVTDAVIHVDFLKLTPGQAIKAEVPVRFSGTSQGVKEGGKLQQTLRKVKIKATPEALVDEITMDITPLKLGQSIRVRDILPIEGVEILNSPGIPVATIEIPRALRSAGAKAEKK